MRHYTWEDFIYSGDRWFVNFLLQGVYIFPPASIALFSISQAIELYLKGVCFKLTSDMNTSIGYGHNMAKLWLDLKMIDPKFMIDFNLDSSILKL